MHPDIIKLLDADQAERMRAWRRAAGMVQADWAREMGVGESTVRNWESGRTPYAYAEQHLAESLVLRVQCRRLAERVRAAGGDRRGEVLACALYASDRATEQTAVRRGLEWSAALRGMGL